MTSRTDLTPANWAALVDAAPAIARAVAASAGSAGQAEAELGAFIDYVSESADEAAGQGILGELVGDIRGQLASGGAATEGDAYMEGLEQARRAGAILAVELEEAEATALRAWYLSAASRVAQATREGGVLGIGSKDVSDWERETIQAIGDALGA